MEGESPFLEKRAVEVEKKTFPLKRGGGCTLPRGEEREFNEGEPYLQGRERVHTFIEKRREVFFALPVREKKRGSRRGLFLKGGKLFPKRGEGRILKEERRS